MKAATTPLQRRPDARMLVVHADGRLDHAARTQLVHHMSPGDLVVANDAATIPASLGGFHEPTGAVIEIRLAGRRSLAVADVYDFTAIVFGDGDHRTRTEHRAPPPALRIGDALRLGPLRATVTCLLGHPRLVRLSFVGTPDEIWGGIARHGKPIQYAHIDRPLMMWDAWTRVAALPVSFEPPSASFVIDWAFLKELQARGVGFATLTLAAGISSRLLLKSLDFDLPLTPERGYHVMMDGHLPGVEIPFVPVERGMIITPMDEGTRFGGTVEFAKLGVPPTRRRADKLLASSRELFPNIEIREKSRWMGERPTLPDYLPAIGPLEKIRNLFVATGHQHLGVTLGAVTGSIISQMIDGLDDPAWAALSPDRFH